MQFISRAYNNFKESGNSKAIILKQSKDKRLLDEYDYYCHLPIDLQPYFPRVFRSYTGEDGLIAVEMEYYAYDNLGNLMTSQKFDRKTWESVYDFIFDFIGAANKHRITASSNKDSFSMYVEKTEREYNSLIKNFDYFKVFEENRTISLNGEELLTFNEVWPKLRGFIENKCLSSEYNYIHGDMCFSNILYGINPINNDVVLKFIDPRGSFGEIKSYGDQYYDLAKLSHSSRGGYEYFITDKFKVEQDKLNFQLTYDNNKRESVHSVFESRVNALGFDKIKIDILEGTIFVGMCARHYDSLERQKAMFLTGLKLLNDVYKKI